MAEKMADRVVTRRFTENDLQPVDLGESTVSMDPDGTWMFVEPVKRLWRRLSRRSRGD